MSTEIERQKAMHFEGGRELLTNGLTRVVLRAAEEHDAEAVRLGALSEGAELIVAVLAGNVVQLLAQVVLALHGQAHHAIRLGRHREKSSQSVAAQPA